MKPHFIIGLSNYTGKAMRRGADGTLRYGMYSQFNITVNAINDYTIQDLNMGSINILLEFESLMTSNELTLSMVYLGIIVCLIISILSIIYIKYHFKDMKLSSQAVNDIH